MNLLTKINTILPIQIQNKIQRSKLVQRDDSWKWKLLNGFAVIMIAVAFCSLPLLWFLKIEINTLGFVGFALVFISLLSIIASLEHALQKKAKRKIL